ncbi:MAG TPA: hypothetical protein VF062_26060, partial [Candidatus Limnocylindrales bacterium]
VLTGVFGFQSVPALREMVENRLEEQRSEYAGELIDKADQLQSTDPDTALRLRIAAAEIDPVTGFPTDDLASFLLMRGRVRPLLWGRGALPSVAERWAVLNHRGHAVAWDMHADPPVEITLGLAVKEISTSSDNRAVAVVTLAGEAIVWNLAASPPQRRTLSQQARSVLVDKSGIWAVISQADGDLVAWHLESGRQRHLGPAGGLHLSIAHDRWLISYGDTEAHAWDLETGTRIAVIRGHRIADPHIDRTGRQLIGFEGQDRKAWRLSDPAAAPIVLGRNVLSYQESADARWIVIRNGTGDKSSPVAWDMAADPPSPRELTGIVRDPQVVGQTVMGADADGNLVLWELPTERVTTARFGSPVDEVRLSSDGRWVMVHLEDNRVFVSEATNLEVRRPVGVSEEAPTAGERWARTVDGQSTSFWDLGSPKPREARVPFRLDPGKAGETMAGGVDPDDRVILVDLSTSPAHIVHIGRAYDLWLVMDDRRVLLVNYDLVTLWDIPPDDLAVAADPVAEACGIARDLGGPMTAQEWERHAPPKVPYHRICEVNDHRP